MKKAKSFNYLIVYNYLRYGCKKVNTMETIDEEGEYILKSPLNPEKELIKKDSYQKLSREAKEIINIVLNSPQDVLELFLNPKRKNISLKRLKQVLIVNWKSTFLVENAIQEIKNWVNKF